MEGALRAKPLELREDARGVDGAAPALQPLRPAGGQRDGRGLQRLQRGAQVTHRRDDRPEEAPAGAPQQGLFADLETNERTDTLHDI